MCSDGVVDVWILLLGDGNLFDGPAKALNGSTFSRAAFLALSLLRIGKGVRKERETTR